MRRTLLSLLFLVSHFSYIIAQTLEECQQAAERNYPQIRHYDLIRQTTDLTVANIGKGWLPQVSAQAQATLQSDVTAFPESMQKLYQQAGVDMKGLKKDQYRIGLDVQQTVYDGGTIRHTQEIARRQGDVEEAQTEVALYQVRRRVNEMYFGSDYLSVKAERLNVVQQGTGLQSQKQSLQILLNAFCGIEVRAVEKPVLPSVEVPQAIGPRPELKAIDAQLRLAEAQEKALDAALKPKLGVFAQGFYGYPGFNMFEDMMRHQWSWNGLIGARLTWNIGALYTRKNDRMKIQLQRSMAETNRDVFLFNNRLEQIQQNENISRFRRLMADDEEIISLRSSVRKAAESKLAHGIIDVNDLVKEINAENNARVQRTVHEIELLKEIYDLKYTTNN